jgi:hypothetical protein
MKTTSPSQRKAISITAAGLFALTTLVLAPTPAQASRLPSDPIVFVAAPVAVAQPSGDSHAASMRALLADLRVETDAPHC